MEKELKFSSKMRKITRTELVVITLGIIFGFSSLFNTNFSNYNNSKGNNETKLKKSGYWEIGPIEIDDDVREEYWTKIRNLPENKNIKVINGK